MKVGVRGAVPLGRSDLSNDDRRRVNNRIVDLDTKRSCGAVAKSVERLDVRQVRACILVNMCDLAGRADQLRLAVAEKPSGTLDTVSISYCCGEGACERRIAKSRTH